MHRKLLIIGFCGLIGLLVWCGQSSTQTTPVPKQTDLTKANQQIQLLQKHLAERDKTIQSMKDKKGGDKAMTDLKAKLDAANQSIVDKDQMIAGLKKTMKDLAAIKHAPYVHSMILKTKKDEDPEQTRLAAATAMKTLGKIAGVRHLWVGRRAEFGSPGGPDKEYQVGVVVLLDDADGLQKFLDDPLYKQFNEKIADYWTSPAVYDILRDPAFVKK